MGNSIVLTTGAKVPIFIVEEIYTKIKCLAQQAPDSCYEFIMLCRNPEYGISKKAVRKLQSYELLQWDNKVHRHVRNIALASVPFA